MTRSVVLAAALAVLTLGPAAAQEGLIDEAPPVVQEPNSIRIEIKLDAKDIELMKASRQHALESYGDGQALTWFNPDSGHSGRVEARPGSDVFGDTSCRQIDEEVQIAGVVYQAPDFYCRLAYGFWIDRKSYTRQFAARAEPQPAERK